MSIPACLMASVALCVVVFPVTTAGAGDLPKQGSFSGTYTSFGTAKATPLGKDRLLFVFEEYGLTKTDGFLNLARYHCWLLGDYSKSIGQEHGSCQVTDPAGDQMVINVVTDPHKLGHDIRATGTFAGGTGKYAETTGSAKFLLNDAGYPSQETYLLDGSVEGTYKLP